MLVELFVVGNGITGIDRAGDTIPDDGLVFYDATRLDQRLATGDRHFVITT